MANSALKLLAQKAKKRLSTAGQNLCEYTSAKTTFAYLSQGNYAIVASKQSLEEDPLYDKVKKIVEDKDILNPLAKLTEKEVFSKLSDLEKERYIIDISKRYNKLRDYFLNQNKNEQK